MIYAKKAFMKRKVTKRTLERSNTRLEMLNECRQVIMRSENKIEMLHDICHHIVNTGGYSAAWIGLLGKDDKKNIVTIGQMGLGENYNLLIEDVWKKLENDRGPTGTAVWGNKISVNTSRPGRRYPAWLSEMKKFGYAASVSFPLKVGKDLAGVLNVYSNDREAFKAEDLDIFMELHKDIIFGIRVTRMHLEGERLKEELMEKDELYELVTSKTGMLIYKHNIHSGSIQWHGEVEALTGYRKSDLEKDGFDGWWKMIHPDDRMNVTKVVDNITKKSGSYKMTYRFRKKDGEYLYIEDNGLMIGGNSALSGNLIGVMRDVTELAMYKDKLEEMVLARSKELAESESRYRNVVENIGIGISIISPRMEILSLNKKMREWFPNIDVGQKPICYKAFNDPPRNEICSYCPTCKSLADGEVHEALTQTPVKGKFRNYRVVSSPLKDSNGKITGAIEMVEDITEKK